MQSDESGQAVVETALVVPLFLFTFLVMLQLMLVAHARVLVDYAAFNACRAGVVHNGNLQVMRSAAYISTLPLYGKTDSIENMAKTWLKLEQLQIVGTALDSVTSGTLQKIAGDVMGLPVAGLPSLEVVHVDVLNPTVDDFEGDAQEIDLDLAQNTNPQDIEALSKTRLSIRVRMLYPLLVPLANRLLFYSFMAAMYFNMPEVGENHVAGILDPRIKTRTGPGVTTRKYIETHDIPTNVPNRPLEIVSDFAMYQGLRLLPKAGFFVMPLYSFYSMPMESNFFKMNLAPGAIP